MAKPLAGASRPGRAVFLGLGILCVGIGAVNLVIPGLPSTIFFILALAAFERSSPRMEQWLLNHRWVGPTLRNWRRTGSIAPRTKALAIATMWVFIGISAWVLSSMWAKGLLLAIGAAVTVFLATRPSR